VLGADGQVYSDAGDRHKERKNDHDDGRKKDGNAETPVWCVSLAAARCIKPAMIAGRTALWDPGAVAMLRPGSPGRPPKGGSKP
jgi:hypothetical protein